jgi:hypothetical protein
MNSKTRKLFAFVAASALVLVFTIPVSAGTQGSCSSSDSMKVFFYENVIGDTGDNNDILAQCGTGQGNLSTVAHTLSGYCDNDSTPKIFADDWEDCIGSMFPYIPSGYLLCIYANLWYSHAGRYYSYSHASSGARINVPSLINNGISSWRFTDTNHPC